MKYKLFMFKHFASQRKSHVELLLLRSQIINLGLDWKQLSNLNSNI